MCRLKILRRFVQAQGHRRCVQAKDIAAFLTTHERIEMPGYGSLCVSKLPAPNAAGVEAGRDASVRQSLLGDKGTDGAGGGAGPSA